jgi:uncharacterized protein
MILSSILVDNILTAPVIAFVVALIATLLKFDLRIPDALYPILSTFLLLAIGIKGGKALSESSPSELWLPLLASIAIGVITPLIAYALFRKTAKLDITNAAALAAHYGSVSAVTFTVLISTLDSHGINYEGYVSGLLAVLEIVGIVVALFLAHKFSGGTDWKSGLSEVVRGKSIAFLVAGLLIGLIVGPDRLAPTDPLFVGLFSGALTLFLVELGAIAANRLRDFNSAGIRVVILGIVVPLINGSIGAALGSAAGMSVGGVAVMATLAASASYIAAPAAIRIALPDASPGIYVTASLGITFPFNLIVGIPLYIEIAELIA